MLPLQLRLAQALTTSLFTVPLLRNMISSAPCQAANGLGTLSINGLPDISTEQSPGTNKYFNFTEIEVWEGWEFPLLILHLLFSHLPPARVSTILRSLPEIPYPRRACAQGLGMGGCADNRSSLTQTYENGRDSQRFTERGIPGTHSAYNSDGQKLLYI